MLDDAKDELERRTSRCCFAVVGTEIELIEVCSP